MALRAGKSHSEYLPPPFCFKDQTLGGWKARKNEKKLRAPYGPKQGCGTLGVSILVADIDWPVDALCEAGIQRLALSLSTHAFSEGPAGASYCALATDFSLTGLNNGHFPLIHIPAFPVNFIILNDAIQNLNAKQ